MKNYLFALVFAIVAILAPTYALAADSIKSSVEATLPVSITDGRSKTPYYFSELSSTEKSLVKNAANVLNHFQQAEKSAPFSENCILNSKLLKTTCISKNGINQLTVIQQANQPIYAECNDCEWECCESFVAACNLLGGGVGLVDGGGYSCHVYEDGTAKPAIDSSFTSGSKDNDTTDVTTSCMGVGDCNELIAVCIEYGGDFTPDSYDPNTGAPSTGTCVTKSDDC